MLITNLDHIQTYRPRPTHLPLLTDMDIRAFVAYNKLNRVVTVHVIVTTRFDPECWRKLTSRVETRQRDILTGALPQTGSCTARVTVSTWRFEANQNELRTPLVQSATSHSLDAPPGRLWLVDRTWVAPSSPKVEFKDARATECQRVPYYSLYAQF